MVVAMTCGSGKSFTDHASAVEEVCVYYGRMLLKYFKPIV